MVLRTLQSVLAGSQLRRHRQALALCSQLMRCPLSTNAENPLSADYLLSDEHKDRVLKCMKNAPPIGIRTKNTNANKQFAAVLIPLCTSGKNTENQVSILYTRRSVKLRSHGGQVSFPGGLQDHNDSDYADSALRETEEEIGLPRSRIEVWGTGNIIKPPHTAAIMPVIGVIRNFDVSELTLNEDEVDEAFTVDIKDLIAPNALRHTQFKSGYSAPQFLVKPHKIWGITGFLTMTFLQCLLPAEIYRPHLKFIKPLKVEESPGSKGNLQ